MTRRTAIAAIVALAAVLLGVPASAADTTRCVFGGAVPGYRALRLELPGGSDFLVIELHGRRDPRPLADESGWHLAEGIMILDAATRELVAYQVLNAGAAPPVLVAETDGTQHARQGVQAPDAPWIHSGRKAPPRLAPGTYDVVAFGTGGPSSGARAQRWGASVYLRGSHACASATAGETFDYNHTHFSGGTQLYAAGIGVADGISLAFDTTRPLVVGLMDATSHGQQTGAVSLQFDLPGHSGTLQGEIAPFVSSAGTHSFTASYRGVHPLVNIAGVALDLPPGAAT